MAYNELHLAPFVLFVHNIVHEFALLTRIDYIYNLLPNAVASYGDRGDMASFDCPKDTTSFVDLVNMASSDDPKDTTSFVDLVNMASSDGHNDAASFVDDYNDTA